MRVRRRHELANIRTLGDVNELAISGHVEHEPRLHEDDDRGCVCEFVLTHTTTSPWEQQRYNVQAYGELGESYATSWQPGQASSSTAASNTTSATPSKAPSPTS
jgi:hypothetical protein